MLRTNSFFPLNIYKFRAFQMAHIVWKGIVLWVECLENFPIQWSMNRPRVADCEGGDIWNWSHMWEMTFFQIEQWEKICRIDSSSLFQRAQIPGPYQPHFWRLSQVSILFLKRSQIKHPIFLGRVPDHKYEWSLLPDGGKTEFTMQSYTNLAEMDPSCLLNAHNRVSDYEVRWMPQSSRPLV